MNARDDELEQIRQRFIQDWESGEKPSLEEYLRRYPHQAGELAEFAAGLFELEVGGCFTSPAAEEPEPEAAAGDPAVQRIMAVLQAPSGSLREARKAAGWTPGQLARKLILPPAISLAVERGTLRDWPARLEERLAEIFCRSREQVRQMLGAPPPRLAAAHFRAEGVMYRLAAAPPAAPSGWAGRTFSELMEECDRRGELTEAQRAEWLAPET